MLISINLYLYGSKSKKHEEKIREKFSGIFLRAFFLYNDIKGG